MGKPMTSVWWLIATGSLFLVAGLRDILWPGFLNIRPSAKAEIAFLVVGVLFLLGAWYQWRGTH